MIRNMDILFKKASEKDIPTLLEIEKSAEGTNIYSAITTKKEWEEELKKCMVYIIEKDSIAVGDIYYEKKSEDHVYLSGIVIKKKFQGQGIARKALGFILEELKNFKRIDLATHPKNEKAIALYTFFGFVVEKKIDNYYGDGEPRLMLVLVK